MRLAADCWITNQLHKTMYGLGYDDIMSAQNLARSHYIIIASLLPQLYSEDVMVRCESLSRHIVVQWPELVPVFGYIEEILNDSDRRFYLYIAILCQGTSPDRLRLWSFRNFRFCRIMRLSSVQSLVTLRGRLSTTFQG